MLLQRETGYGKIMIKLGRRGGGAASRHKFEFNSVRDIQATFSATASVGANPVFSLEPRKHTESLDRAGSIKKK